MAMPKRKLTPKEKEASRKKFRKKINPFVSTKNRIDLNPFIKNKEFSPIKIMFPKDESTKFKKAYIELLKTRSKEPQSFYSMPLEYFIESETNVKERFDLLWSGLETAKKEKGDLWALIQSIDKLPNPAMTNPWPLIDAINNGNEIVLRINLNHKRATIQKDISRLLTIAFKELEKNNRKILKISARDFSFYWSIYDLHRNKKWKYPRIAKKIFPEEFKELDPFSEDKSVSIPNPESAVIRTKQIFKEAERMIEG
jgi:hypothetical protein